MSGMIRKFVSSFARHFRFAPIRTSLAVVLFIPPLLMALTIISIGGAGLLRTLYALIYGLFGLDVTLPPVPIELTDFFYSILHIFIPIGGWGTKITLSLPYALAALIVKPRLPEQEDSQNKA